MIDNFVYVCDNAFKKSDILDMESVVISDLNYELLQPIIYDFLQIYLVQNNQKVDCPFTRVLFENIYLDIDYQLMDKKELVESVLFFKRYIVDKCQFNMPTNYWQVHSMFTKSMGLSISSVK